MLFERRKKDEKLQHILENFCQKNEEAIAALEKNLRRSLEEELRKTVEEGAEKRLEEKLEQNREENSKLLRRQSGSLEDILEELQHQSEDKESVKAQLQKMRDREKALVELCCVLSGQKEMILQQLLAEGTFPDHVRAGWQRQAELMKQEAEKYERQCAFRKIGECGEKIDYECHQILSVCTAEREEQGGTVAQVYAPGYSYDGQMIKKAQVSAYKAEEKQIMEGK